MRPRTRSLIGYEPAVSKQKGPRLPMAISLSNNRFGNVTEYLAARVPLQIIVEFAEGPLSICLGTKGSASLLDCTH